METVRTILRAFSVAIGIGAYFAGWMFYMHICITDDEHMHNWMAVFYAIWTTIHLLVGISGLTWAWL